MGCVRRDGCSLRAPIYRVIWVVEWVRAIDDLTWCYNARECIKKRTIDWSVDGAVMTSVFVGHTMLRRRQRRRTGHRRMPRVALVLGARAKLHTKKLERELNLRFDGNSNFGFRFLF